METPVSRSVVWKTGRPTIPALPLNRQRHFANYALIPAGAGLHWLAPVNTAAR